MRWQNGTSISQCDGFKNESYHYCEYVTEHSLDRELTDRISSLLKSDKNNWLWDIYRLFNVFQTEKVEHVMLSSIQTRTLIQNCSLMLQARFQVKKTKPTTLQMNMIKLEKHLRY